MMFNNLLAVLDFYSSSSKEGTQSIVDTIASLKSSLSEYANIKIIDCGSFIENLYIPLSIMDPIQNETTLNFDSDHLIVDMDYLAYEFSDSPSTMINDKKMLLLKNSPHPGCIYLFDARENIDIPLKTANFMLQQIQKYRPKLNVANTINFDRALGIRTGPSFAATSGVSGTLGNHVNTDLVFCVQCQQWPSIAKEWLTRESKTDWPTSNTKHLVANHGCYIVPTGFDESEWRFSFSFAELQLIGTLDNVYKRVYAILKILIKYACKSENITGLKSYHLKTIFLWYCEEMGVQSHAPIKVSIENLLNYTTEFYKRQYVPHYFIPACNLLCEISTEVIKLYYETLSKLKKNIDTMLIQFIDNTYYSFVLLKSNLLELYTKNDSRLRLFFKYTFLLYSLYGVLHNEQSLLSFEHTTDIDYNYYFSLVTSENEVTVTIDKILGTIESNIGSDSVLLSLEEISGIICAVWWCSFNLKTAMISDSFYDCIFWASRMHAYYCDKIIDRFIYKAPKIICKTKDSENYKNLLSIIIHHPTAQTENLKRYIIKSNFSSFSENIFS
ncbi:unnamed protein product [Rotaria magnacalcarata]|uniref:Uncharacterized protein n=1 Tax=Rotaria magnacalcarata TaxID=392030 RepID=A0A816X4G1_9BILA|nr:unnamed protein product [Rotaria magnacalcarata]CAF4284682.1 unnamed protein product [Rotaria magnacalcarata]